MSDGLTAREELDQIKKRTYAVRDGSRSQANAPRTITYWSVDPLEAGEWIGPVLIMWLINDEGGSE